MQYVHNRTLSLIDYTLGIGHCNALSVAFQYFGNQLNRIILENCGIDDDEFAAMLEGIKQLKDFKKIIYKRNTFHKKSVLAIKDLFQRNIPNHLEELRIENCKMEPTVSEDLIKYIHEKNQFKSLGLVNINFTESTFETLVDTIVEADYLTDIDISWNALKPNSF